MYTRTRSKYKYKNLTSSSCVIDLNRDFKATATISKQRTSHKPRWRRDKRTGPNEVQVSRGADGSALRARWDLTGFTTPQSDRLRRETVESQTRD